MSIRYEVDFSEDILAGRGVTLSKNLFDLQDCHKFSILNENVRTTKVKLLPGKLVKKTWLFGPACNIDKTVIYPCSRYRCSLPCPCSLCLKITRSSCETSASCCSCNICSNQFKGHGQFHGTFHFGCKFCANLLSCFPAFNFWFLNHAKRVVNYFGTLREHFDVKNLVVNVHPEALQPNPNCMLMFRNYDIYHNKVEDYSASGWMTCEECDYSVLSIKQFREHIELNHMVSKRFFHCYIEMKKEDGCFNCHICTETHESKKALERHVRRYHYAQTYSCNLCPDEFTRKDSLKRHKMCAHKEKETIKCSDCGNSFTRRDTLTRHKNLVHGGLKCLICDECNTEFNAESSLLRHKNSACNTDGSFRHCCDKCQDKHFCTSKLLRQHSNVEHISLTCKDCGSKFSNKDNLETHVSKRKFESCKECDAILCNLRALSIHIHSSAQCDVCHKSFPKNQVKYHKLYAHEHKISSLT